MKLDMQYLKSNAKLPYGEVFSTARKGDKWYYLVGPGDVLNLTDTASGTQFARAVVIYTILGTREQALSAAHQNSAKDRDVLNKQLIEAYGPGLSQDVYSIIGLLIINE